MNARQAIVVPVSVILKASSVSPGTGPDMHGLTLNPLGGRGFNRGSEIAALPCRRIRNGMRHLVPAPSWVFFRVVLAEPPD
jgi:hypothetical protein